MHLRQEKKTNGKIEFHFTIGKNFFFEIAKLRAFRILWKSQTNQDPFITTSTSKKNQSSGVNNIFKTTTECISAILGGTNALITNAHDSDYNEYNDFSSRVARNQFNVLTQESHLNKVKDTGRGSYYIEYLTKEFLKEFDVNIKDSTIKKNSEYSTNENILIKEYYKKEDLAELEHLDSIAGQPPFLRGPYSTMYVNRPWTIRQYAGFSTAKESNEFYKKKSKSWTKRFIHSF